VSELVAGYGALTVLRGVTIDVSGGEIVAILGANGAGKSTLLRAISRVGADVTAGTITFAGADITRADPIAIVRRGLLHVPEGRHLFSDLTVEENLRLGAYLRPRAVRAAAVDASLQRFPALAARRAQTAASVSGGEQQMLAIARALVATPRLLMLDEPSTGLSPQMSASIFATLETVRADGTALLLVEQNAFVALAIADRAYVFEHGTVALEGPAAALRDDPRVQSVYLGGNAGER
jgi:branched-chain amino acid transport system ATP-binding protein